MHLQTLLDGGAYGSYGVASTFYTGALQTVTYQHPALPLRGLPRLHQQAAVRPQARPRHAAEPLRPGSAARQDRRARWRSIPADLRLRHRSRRPTSLTANYLRVGTIGLAECIRARGRAFRLAREAPQAAARPRRRARLLVVPVGRRAADLLERHAALGRAAEARSQRRRHRVLRRHRDRPGLATTCWSTCVAEVLGHRSVRHPRGHRRHRSHAGRSRLLLEPRDADDGQRRDPGRRARARPARRGGGAQARRAAGTGWSFAERRVFDSEDPGRGVSFARGGVPRRGGVRHHRHHRLVHAAEVARRSSRAAASGRRRPTRTPPRSSRWRSIPRPAGSPCRGSGSRTTSAARSIPMLVRGQVEGSVYMGLGEALMEEQAFRRLPPRLSHALVHKFPSMLEYKSPTTLDMPEIFTDLVEDPDPARPVRRQGSRPGAAAADHAGGRQRRLRRGRRAHRRGPGDAGEDR